MLQKRLANKSPLQVSSSLSSPGGMNQVETLPATPKSRKYVILLLVLLWREHGDFVLKCFCSFEWMIFFILVWSVLAQTSGYLNLYLVQYSLTEHL